MATVVEPRDPSIDLLDAPASRSNTSLLSVVWQRKSLVVLGIVIFSTLGALFYAQRTPVYQTGAQVLVVKRSPGASGPAIGPSAIGVMMEDYMSTQTIILKSQEIATRTAHWPQVCARLDDTGFRAFPDAKNPDQLVAGIMGGLIVTRDNKESTGMMGNNVLMLSFRCTNAEEGQFLLANLIMAYQAYIDDTYKDISDSMMRDIKKQYDEYTDKGKKNEEEYTKFLSEAPPGALRGKGISAVEKDLLNLQEQISKYKNELREKSLELESITKKHADLGATAVMKYLQSRGGRRFYTGDEEKDKLIASLKIQEKEALAQFAENHPNVKILRGRIELLAKGTDETPDGKPVNSDENAIQGYLTALKIDVETLGARISSYTEAQAKQAEDYRSNLHWEFKERRIEEDRTNTSVMFSAIRKKLDDLDQRKDSGGFHAKTLTKAGIGVKIAPDPFQVFTAAGLLGVLLGIGLAYLAEVSDKSFRNPAEIRRRLGLPVIGHVPFMAADEKAAQLVASGSATLDPMLVTHYQSNSIGAEAYRGVRTALYFNTQGAGHQVIQVTSPNVSDGKSTLAANLAVSIAQSGKRTLLIDCDFRKPRVHKIFNIPAHLGMASAMAGQADLNSCIQSSAIPNLSIMPCGPRPANPAELLTSPKFSELIEELRRTFDFVVVDTPPILVVTDPAVVAPRVDGVVLCIRVTKNGRPFAERAREVLQSLGANVIGVVVNGFGSQVGGNKYGYEHYNYGYGESYSYTYGYTYGYADKEAASYYGGANDEAAKDPAAKS